MMDEQQVADLREHPSSGLKYVVALIALLVLTALTFGLHFAPLGGTLGSVATFSIASIKVAIVGLIFMELRESMAATRLIAAVSVVFVVLLCLGIIGDVVFR